MSEFTYKTKDGTQSGFVPGVGEIVDGKITTDRPLESPNLIDENEVKEAAFEATASQENPNLPDGVQL